MSPLYSPRRNVSFKSNIYVWHVIVTKIRMACNSHKNARKLYFSERDRKFKFTSKINL